MADGFAIVVPTRDVPRLTKIPGIVKVWPNLTYHELSVTRTTVTRGQALTQGPQVIGADKLWGNGLTTAGEGMKIGVIDDGVDAKHAYFDPAGYTYPAGYPKGIKSATTPKVIVQRTFAPASPVYRFAKSPFDPSENGSFHATHVAGIAAGDHNTQDGALFLSGIAPDAFIGNYKALIDPDARVRARRELGADRRSDRGSGLRPHERDQPLARRARDLPVARHRRPRDRRRGGGGRRAGDRRATTSSTSTATARSARRPTHRRAITVAATTLTGTIADFSSGGPTPVSLKLKPDVSAPGVAITSSLPVNQSGPYGAMSGTSMAAPQVSGAVALLMQRHPDWTVAQIKSALVQTGDPVRDRPATRSRCSARAAGSSTSSRPTIRSSLPRRARSRSR